MFVKCPAVKPRLKAVLDAKHQQWERANSASSIKQKRRLPFEKGLGPLAVESNGSEDGLSLGQRTIRNQVLTRTAPVAGRAIVSAGTLLVAGGASAYARTKPTFVSITKRAAIRRAKLDARGRGMKWQTLYRQRYPVGTVHYRSGYTTRGITEQRRRALQRHGRRAVARTAVGTSAIALGRGLPVLAYGYIGYDIAKRSAGGEEVDIKGEIERTTFGITVEQAVSQSTNYYSVGKVGLTLAKGIIL